MRRHDPGGVGEHTVEYLLWQPQRSHLSSLRPYRCCPLKNPPRAFGVAYFRLVDAVTPVIAIENVSAAIDQIAQAILREVVGQHTLDEACTKPTSPTPTCLSLGARCAAGVRSDSTCTGRVGTTPRAAAHNDPVASTGRSSPEPLAAGDRPQESGRIVVGVDGSRGSLNALMWAFGEARARKIPVHAVLAWQYHPSWVDPGLGSMFPLGYRPDDRVPPDEFTDAAAAVKSVLGAAVSKAIESDPDSATDPVPITQETVEGHAAQVLLENVSGCDLMVVGSHGHGGFVGAILGSVSHHVVSHSRCPVVVVPAPQRAATG